LSRTRLLQDKCRTLFINTVRPRIKNPTTNTTMTDNIPIIGTVLEYYGYIIGLQFERGDSPASPDVPSKMLATFECGDSTKTWQVPDHHLFAELAKQLCENALMRDEHKDYGISELAIQKTKGMWIATLP